MDLQTPRFYCLCLEIHFAVFRRLQRQKLPPLVAHVLRHELAQFWLWICATGNGSLNRQGGIILLLFLLLLPIWLAILTWPLGEFPISQRQAPSACCVKANVKEVWSLKGAEVWLKPHYRCRRPLDSLFLCSVEYILALHRFGLSEKA